MAMTIKTEGLDELNQMLAELGNRAEEVASKSLYEGAGVVANAFSAAVSRIHTEPFRYANGGNMRKASPEEKAALMGKSGVARFQKNGGEVNTLIGISGSAGYANIGGKPKAVRMIARAINSGTSFMVKQPVFRQAKSTSTGAAQAAIVAKAEQMFDEIIKG